MQLDCVELAFVLAHVCGTPSLERVEPRLRGFEDARVDRRSSLRFLAQRERDREQRLPAYRFVV